MKLLTTKDLAERWAMSPRTIEKQRAEAPDEGPPFVRIGRNVRYRPQDVERWEEENLQAVA